MLSKERKLYQFIPTLNFCVSCATPTNKTIRSFVDFSAAKSGKKAKRADNSSDAGYMMQVATSVSLAISSVFCETKTSQGNVQTGIILYHIAQH